MVKLSNAHIILNHKMVNDLFNDAAQVSWVYYPKRDTMLIAASTDELFKSLHKTATNMLKHKNDKGDRSISVMELLIDNEIDLTNRDLEYKADEQMKILNIHFGIGVNLPIE